MDFVFQIPSFLTLLAYIAAAIVAGVAGRRSPKSAKLAVAGFCLLALAFVVSVFQGYFSPSLGAGGGLLVSSGRAVIYIGGIVLLVLAVVNKGSGQVPPPSPGQQYPSQQPQQWQPQPQPQQPQQQYPGQQPQQGQPQPPQQGQPPQQYPGQQPQQWPPQQHPRQQ